MRSITARLATIVARTSSASETRAPSAIASRSSSSSGPDVIATSRTSGHLVNVPRAGHALEVVLAAIDELEPRTHDELLHRRRHEHLPGPRHRRDASADVHREALHLAVGALDLASV